MQIIYYMCLTYNEANIQTEKDKNI